MKRSSIVRRTETGNNQTDWFHRCSQTVIAHSIRPSDDATTLQFLVPSNFFAVSSLRKAAEILEKVNKKTALSKECKDLAQEVETALKKYAVYNHPKYGKIYAFEVDGFGNHHLMDDANVPSLLAMP